MLIPQIVLTAILLAFGSSLALADSVQVAPMEMKGVNALSPLMVNNGEGAKTKEDKLQVLESKIKTLETRINQLSKTLSLPQPALNLEQNPYDANTVQAMHGWSSEDHLLEAKAHHQQSEALEGKIQQVQDRIDRFSQKSYLDTKGFKRAGLKNLKGSLVQELREATIKTVWHKAQAEKIMTSESQHQQNS